MKPTQEQERFIEQMAEQMAYLETLLPVVYEYQTGDEIEAHTNNLNYLISKPCIWYRKPCQTDCDDRTHMSKKGLYKVIGLCPIRFEGEPIEIAPIFFVSKDVYDTIKRRHIVNEEHDHSIAPTLSLRFERGENSVEVIK